MSSFCCLIPILDTASLPSQGCLCAPVLILYLLGCFWVENLSNEQLAITAECVRAPSKYFQITGYQLTKLENKVKIILAIFS